MVEVEEEEERKGGKAEGGVGRAQCLRWDARAGPAADRANRRGRERKKREDWREDVVNQRRGNPQRQAAPKLSRRVAG